MCGLSTGDVVSSRQKVIALNLANRLRGGTFWSVWEKSICGSRVMGHRIIARRNQIFRRVNKIHSDVNRYNFPSSGITAIRIWHHHNEGCRTDVAIAFFLSGLVSNCWYFNILISWLSHSVTEIDIVIIFWPFIFNGSFILYLLNRFVSRYLGGHDRWQSEITWHRSTVLKS